MCIPSCRGAGTSTGSGNTRITQRASNPTECQVFLATRKAILTAILMTARGRNSTTNGRPTQAAIASRAYRSISLQSASNGSQRHPELLRELRAIKREINSVPKNRDLSLVAYASLVQLHRFFYFATFLVGSSRIDLLRPPPAVWRGDGCANHFRGLVERRDHRVGHAFEAVSGHLILAIAAPTQRRIQRIFGHRPEDAANGRK